MFAGSISHVEESDFPRLYQLTEDAVREKVDATDEDKIVIIDAVKRHMNEAMLLKNSVFLKAVVSGEIAGFVLFKNHFRLSDLFVAPLYHFQGVGRALFISGIERLDDQETLDVYAAKNAIGFYQSLGFSSIKLEHPVPAFIQPMRLQLRSCKSKDPKRNT
ncbi:GNAT family N-acetyltransferase [Veronia pacifica]|uniref:N-acetyltransferase domain-containing protein n=1 Tax=Veronia pacifica TaxID=1080227 RepID=A0A1C3ER15_9GAMM|nr:GNAT family N-acetyltransferase [Veronia pacifica]ODA35639.1 hypothetical protein A8L45_03210 [Veronia pacifica]